MDDTIHRLRIAKELLAKWASELPRLLRRIDEAGQIARVTEGQKIDLEMTSKKIVRLYSKASEMADLDQNVRDLDSLTATTSQLQEEIAIAIVILNKLAVPLK